MIFLHHQQQKQHRHLEPKLCHPAIVLSETIHHLIVRGEEELLSMLVTDKPRDHPEALKVSIPFNLPDITGRTALAVRPDVVNAKYHVITNATYNRDPVPAKFKHVTNIDTCTLLCCDYSTLWEALHVNMVEIGARCSDENVKILVSCQWIG